MPNEGGVGGKGIKGNALRRLNAVQISRKAGRIDGGLVHLLNDAEKKHMEWVDVFGFCRHKNRSGFVRVVAQRLSENQAEKAKKRREGGCIQKTAAYHGGAGIHVRLFSDWETGKYILNIRKM